MASLKDSTDFVVSVNPTGVVMWYVSAPARTNLNHLRRGQEAHRVAEENFIPYVFLWKIFTFHDLASSKSSGGFFSCSLKENEIWALSNAFFFLTFCKFSFINYELFLHRSTFDFFFLVLVFTVNLNSGLGLNSPHFFKINNVKCNQASVFCDKCCCVL